MQTYMWPSCFLAIHHYTISCPSKDTHVIHSYVPIRGVSCNSRMMISIRCSGDSRPVRPKKNRKYPKSMLTFSMIIAEHNRQNQRFRLSTLTRWLTCICCLPVRFVGVGVTAELESVGDKLPSSVKPLIPPPVPLPPPLPSPPTHGINSPTTMALPAVDIAACVRRMLFARLLPFRRQSVNDGNSTLECVAVVKGFGVTNGSEFIVDVGCSQWPIWWWWFECSVTSGNPLKHDVVCCNWIHWNKWMKKIPSLVRYRLQYHQPASNTEFIIYAHNRREIVRRC